MTSRQTFAVTWDYRCPFARIAHEHILDGLEAGAPWDVTFVPFFLNQSHVPEGGVPAWDDPAQQPDLVALAAGVVVRDRIPEQFHAVHRALFTARHGEGRDLRDRAVVAEALAGAGVDAGTVLSEVDSGWPTKQIRSEHEGAVSRLDVFGVPTFIVGDDAVFVRLMAGPEGDAHLARATVDRVLALMANHPDLNEFKHTRLVG
jgi:DSBA-like thioredoxin domain